MQHETGPQAVDEPQEEAVDEPQKEAVDEPQEEAVDEPQEEAVLDEPQEEAVLDEPEEEAADDGSDFALRLLLQRSLAATWLQATKGRFQGDCSSCNVRSLCKR